MVMSVAIGNPYNLSIYRHTSISYASLHYAQGQIIYFIDFNGGGKNSHMDDWSTDIDMNSMT